MVKNTKLFAIAASFRFFVRNRGFSLPLLNPKAKKEEKKKKRKKEQTFPLISLRNKTHAREREREERKKKDARGEHHRR